MTIKSGTGSVGRALRKIKRREEDPEYAKRINELQKVLCTYCKVNKKNRVAIRCKKCYLKFREVNKIWNFQQYQKNPNVNTS